MLLFYLVRETPWWKMLLLAVWGCLMLPALPSWDIRGWREINSLNGASWSLLWEYIANILYALFIRHFSKWLLVIFVALSALLTIGIAFNIDVTSLLEVRSYASYTVIGGFGLSPDQLFIGISRLLYPFFAGLLLSRINKLIKVCGGFWWCSLLVAAILVIPYVGTESHPWIDGAYNAVAIIILFPLIVAMGAGSRVTDTLHGSLQVLGRNLLSAIYHPLSVDLCPDELCGPLSGCAARYAYMRGRFHLPVYHSHCLRQSETV